MSKKQRKTNGFKKFRVQIRVNGCQKTVKYLCGVVNGVEKKQQNRTANFFNV